MKHHAAAELLVKVFCLYVDLYLETNQSCFTAEGQRCVVLATVKANGPMFVSCPTYQVAVTCHMVN